MIIKHKSIFKLLKIIFEISIITLFVGSYFRIFNGLPSNVYIKITYTIIYLWFTIGINLNLILSLLKLFNNKIKKL